MLPEMQTPLALLSTALCQLPRAMSSNSVGAALRGFWRTLIAIPASSLLSCCTGAYLVLDQVRATRHCGLFCTVVMLAFSLPRLSFCCTPSRC